MFAVMSKKTASRLKLKVVPYHGPKKIVGWDLSTAGWIHGRARVRMTIASLTKHYWVWIVTEAAGYDMILGAGWMELEDVMLEPAHRRATMRKSGMAKLECKVEQGARDHLMEAAGWLQTNEPQSTTPKLGSRLSSKLIFSDPKRILLAVGLKPGDIEIALEKLEKSSSQPKLPSWAADLRAAFDPRLNEQGLELNQRTEFDAEVKLTTDDLKNLPHAKPRPLGQQAQVLLKRMIGLMEDKGFIQVSKSPIASPVHFAHKPGGGARLVIDFKHLNGYLVKDSHPISRIDNLLRLIAGAPILTKLDISAAFHRLRIASGDEWKTAFTTPFGLYEWKVLPFGLQNAPSCFQRYINHVLRERIGKDVAVYIGKDVAVYIDDIVIYSTDINEHRKTVRWVLQKLIEAGLPADAKKSEFETDKIEYLGYIVHAGQGISMNPKKVEAIANYIRPTCVTGIRRFLGIAIEYRRFIPRFAELTAPLTDMLQGSPKKKSLVTWTDRSIKAFELLKKAFTTSINNGGILKDWESGKPCRLETDASAWAAAGQLLQFSDKHQAFLPIYYESHKWNKPERNWHTHDKELGAVVHCLKAWEPELRESPEITAVTDHHTLQFFQTSEQRSEKQIRWKEGIPRYVSTKVAISAG
jgi:hypothetical protein